MADESNERTVQPQERTIVGNVGMFAIGETEEGEPLIVKTQGDGTLRAWGIHVGVNEDGQERPVCVEVDRSLCVALRGKNESGDLVSFEVNDRGELKVSARTGVNLDEVVFQLKRIADILECFR